MTELNNISDKTKKTLKNVGKEAVANSSEFLEALKKRAVGLSKDVLDKTKPIGKVLKDSISRNPYKAVGISFLLGIMCATYKKLSNKVTE